MDKVKVDKEDIKQVLEQGEKIVKNIANKTSDTVGNVVHFVSDKLDQNGDGNVDIADIIALAIKVPGVHINRASFLKKELLKNHEQSVIDDAIVRTPALAGIPSDEINKIADEVIKLERIEVSGISAALGTPGGFAMAATIPADIIQYYGYTLRAAQKLLYLYGFPEIDGDEEGLNLDSETTNELILCLGVMNGVAGANNAIKGFAKALSIGVEKKLVNASLTKGVFFPLVKSIAKWFGVKLTKSMFAGFFKKAIPVVGGVVGGGITFLTFKPCCYRLKNVLQDTLLSNLNHKSSQAEEDFVSNISNGTIVDADFEVVVPEAEPFKLEDIEE